MALALNPGANQYTGPACGTKKCFIAAAAAGDISTTINKGRRAGPMSSLLFLDVYDYTKNGTTPTSFWFIFVLLKQHFTENTVDFSEIRSRIV